MNSMHVKKGDKVQRPVRQGQGQGGRRSCARFRRSSASWWRRSTSIKKAMRPTQQNPQGGIASMEAPIHVSNVMLVCPDVQAAHATGKRVNDDGKKVRVCKKCGKDID